MAYSTYKTRREVLGALTASGLLLIGCDDGADSVATLSDAVNPDALADAMVLRDAESRDAAQLDAAQLDADGLHDASLTDAALVDGWATGGTASIRGKDNYPDPFADAAGDMCVVVTAATAGPCTTATDLDREDISEGRPGLPMRLGLRIVDSRCQPLSGALVRVWHTNNGGSYSGQTPDNGFCLLDQNFAQSDFFRGVRTTNADGVVWFDSCFPGWYPNRAIHLHFQIVQDGRSTQVSQLTFTDETITQIIESHPEYQGRGLPDTSVATDFVFRPLTPAKLSELTLDIARMQDGVMLASKTIAVV